MINPTFIADTGFEPDDEALRLIRFNQTMIIGSLIMEPVLSVLTAKGLSFASRFFAITAVALTAFVVVFLTNVAAANRIKTSAPRQG